MDGQGTVAIEFNIPPAMPPGPNRASPSTGAATRDGATRESPQAPYTAVSTGCSFTQVAVSSAICLGSASETLFTASLAASLAADDKLAIALLTLPIVIISMNLCPVLRFNDARVLRTEKLGKQRVCDTGKNC